MGLSDREFEVMKKYKVGEILDEKDRGIVERLASIGVFKTGYHEVPLHPETQPPAATTQKKRTGLLRCIRECLYDICHR